MKPIDRAVFLMFVALAFGVAAIYLFAIVAPWVTAIEPDLLPVMTREEALNSKWVAAIKDRGVWRQWELGAISQRPAFFVVHLVLLVFCGVSALLAGFCASKIYKSAQGGIGK